MKWKFLIPIGIIITTLLCISASAEEIYADFSKETSTLSIKGDFGEENAFERVTALVLSGDDELTQNEASQNDVQLSTNVIVSATKMADENGIVEFSPVTVSEFSGKCMVYVGIYGGTNTLKKELFLSSKNDIESFESMINSSNSSSEIKKALDSEAEEPKFYADMNWYKQLSDNGKTQVSEMILYYMKEGRYKESNESHIKNLDDDIVTSSVIVYASEKKDADLVKELLNIEESSFTEYYKEIIKQALDLNTFRQTQSGADTYKADDKVYTLISENGFANAEQFRSAAKAGLISYKLGKITVWNEIDEILENYKEDLAELDYSKLEEQKNMSDAMTAIYDGVPYKNISDLTSRINKILSKDYSGKSGGSKDEGGSGRSVSYSSFNSYVPENNYNDRSYIDVLSSHWAYDSIKYLTDIGVVSGTGNKYFEPERNVTREEFVQMICSAFNLKDSMATADFDDVMSGDWYEAAIASAQSKNIVGGITGNLFGIGMNISRQDMAVIAYRTLLYIQPDEKYKEIITEEPFADNEYIDEYAAHAVDFMHSVGVINGVGNDIFAPQSNATRAQAAKIIYALMDYAHKSE